MTRADARMYVAGLQTYLKLSFLALNYRNQTFDLLPGLLILFGQSLLAAQR